MAEANCYIPTQFLDLDQIQQEAIHRWLRPAEVCEILTNYQKFELRSSPPDRPPAGSLFLFDKKVVRYFRKDGHSWRKKKDGKIVKEAHEKLKSGSVDVLHCYYAHGESNENFQRRSYWMLDKRFENIVLVHYREVKEGCKSRVLNSDSGTQLQSCQSSEQATSPDQSLQTSYDSGCLFGSEFDGNAFNPDPDLSMWSNIHGSVKNEITADFLSHKLTDAARLDGDSNSQDFFSSGTGFTSLYKDSEGMNTYVENSNNDDNGGLKKLDSFGRWMDKEMGEDSLTAPNYWNALEIEDDKNQMFSLSHHMQLSTDSVGPSLVNEQFFSICDFAPDWAYSGTETKVLITGTFLGDKKRMSDIKWCCMFGETEVVAEVVTENAIRCQVPLHGAGRVPFYITCSNRLACSEVRDFEYIEWPARLAGAVADSDAKDEFGLLVRFSKLLSSGIERKWLDCSIENCEKCKLKDVFHSLVIDKERCWKSVTEAFKENSKELLIQNLLKDKLYEWLVCEAHESCEGLRMLDEKGQGIIHLAAALGYEWAISPITGAGLSPNFRDAHGRTALHWASLYGREEMAVTLVKLGAFAGAVDDPTPQNPGGQTAADLAWSKGHKGIAGYLAETDLTSHLSALSVKDNTIIGKGNEHGLAATAAVRRSERAAAVIQDLFRAHSFRQKQASNTSDIINDLDLTPEAEEVAALAAAAAAASSSHMLQKTGHFEDYLHVAASRIQQKYRGWRGRNDFLKIRDRIVKIQAHFRGHQVRKHYKKVVWSVGIVEKAILRWRRKSRGLRGFKPESTSLSGEGVFVEKGEYDFLRISRKQKRDGVENALARVHSMARHPEAQEQYMRMVSKFEKLTHEDEGS